MQVTYNFVKPIAGGGLGDCKIGIVELAGTYVTGGVDLGIKEEPLFMFASDGYGATFASGKIKITSAGGSSGGEVVIPEQTVSGVSVQVTGTTVSGVEFTNEQAIQGAVDGSTATIAIGDADVSGSVVVPDLTGSASVTIPSQTVSVTGSSSAQAGEIANGTSVAGLKILFVIKGSY